MPHVVVIILHQNGWAKISYTIMKAGEQTYLSLSIKSGLIFLKAYSGGLVLHEVAYFLDTVALIYNSLK